MPKYLVLIEEVDNNCKSIDVENRGYELEIEADNAEEAGRKAIVDTNAVKLPDSKLVIYSIDDGNRVYLSVVGEKYSPQLIERAKNFMLAGFARSPERSEAAHKLNTEFGWSVEQLRRYPVDYTFPEE
jgi:hypothetical protein